MTTPDISVQVFSTTDLNPQLLGKHIGHKYDYGHLLVFAGGAGKTGAARLAARAGLRVGTGLVTLAAPRDACSEIGAQITAVMLRPFADTDAVAALLDDRRISAIAVGPGFGLQANQANVLEVILSSKRKTVLDADALTLISQNPNLFQRLHPNCIMTPHDGEFARLFPDLTHNRSEKGDDDLPRIVEGLKYAVHRAKCSILLKGADTLVATPGAETVLHRAKGDMAAPWLATAGSGDVLTGLIGGLLARGFDLQDAANYAVWLHAECARSFGPGLIAEDLSEELPKVLAKVIGGNVRVR